MKRKSLLLFISMACISMMLAACTGDVSTEVEPAEEQEIIIAEVQPEAGAEEVIEAEVEPEVEEEVPEEPEVDPNVELSEKYFAVSEEWARDYGGLYLERDGQLYSVTDAVPEQNYYETGIGAHYIDGKAGIVGIHADDNYDSYVVHDLDIVFPSYDKGDKAINYIVEGYSPDCLTFIPVEQDGYTISAYDYNKDGCKLCVLEDWNDTAGGCVWFANYETYDSDGNSVDDIRNLEKGKEYTVKGDGGDVTLTANCRYFRLNKKDAIQVTGVDQGDDSFIYDLSELPSGDYYVKESYGFITIE